MSEARILIVEDEPLVADDIQRSLKKLSYQVVGRAVSGAEAIELTEKLNPDLALLDISIKGKMDGVELGMELKERFGTALIYLTAHSDQATFERAKITEPYGYIVKPFQEADLRIALGLALYKRAQEVAHGIVPAATEPASAPEEVNGGSNEASAQIGRFLRSIELFSSMSPADLQSLVRQCRIESHSHGTLISCEGEREDSCFLVYEGRVSLVKTSENGNQLVVEILFPGDLFSIVSAFEEEVASLTARVQKNVQIIRFPKKSFFSLLSRQPEFYKVFVRESTRRLKAAHNMMRAIAHDKVESRVASTLAELAKRPSACPVPEDGITITRQEIADLTGTSVETAIRVTRAMEEDGILELGKRGYVKILKPKELKELISV